MGPGVKGHETKISVKIFGIGIYLSIGNLCNVGFHSREYIAPEHQTLDLSVRDKNRGMSNHPALEKFRAKRLVKKGPSKGELRRMYTNSQTYF